MAFGLARAQKRLAAVFLLSGQPVNEWFETKDYGGKKRFSGVGCKETVETVARQMSTFFPKPEKVYALGTLLLDIFGMSLTNLEGLYTRK
ncbi:MAG: hypothetical protein ABMA02_08910 [Saprospiraceae bacterium]